MAQSTNGTFIAKGSQFGVTPDDIDIDGVASFLTDNDGNPIYCGELLSMDDGTLTVSVFKNSEYGDSFVLPEDYVRILNEGIKLAERGYKTVKLENVDKNEHTGDWDELFSDVQITDEMKAMILGAHEDVRAALEGE